MSVLLVCLDPKQLLASMLHLRLIADPRRPGKKHITLQDIKECK